jgi:Fe-S cluster assembly ATP-binding protein
VHVLVRGRVQASGGPELAEELERSGYAAFSGPDDEEEAPVAALADPFADPL